MEQCRQKIYLHEEKESAQLNFYIFSSEDPDFYENEDALYDIFDDQDIFYVNGSIYSDTEIDADYDEYEYY